MQLLDIVNTPNGSDMTLCTQSTADIASYVVFLKRFTDSGGGTVMSWSRDEVERTISTRLEDAHGFHIIIAATTRPGAQARMRADLTIGDYTYNALFEVPQQDNIGWSVILRNEEATATAAGRQAQLIGHGTTLSAGPGGDALGTGGAPPCS